jgi:molybdopterin adenylyltransferase
MTIGDEQSTGTAGARPPAGESRSAFVLTVSDRSVRGERDDVSGERLAARLAELGFDVDRGLVPDEPDEIAAATGRAATDHALVVVTGGTGLTPRDVTPQALLPLLDYEVPGVGERMRLAGRTSTPHADLSRSFGGVIGRALVLAVPGSPRGAVESLDAVAVLLPHALDMIRGSGDHPE